MNENYDSFWIWDPKSRRESLTYSDMTFDFRRRSNSLLPYAYEVKIEEPVVVEKTQQQLIDEAVAEAIEKPKREAEIAKRVAAVEKISAYDDLAIGAVLRWKRNWGKNDYLYVAVKTGENRWHITGSGQFSTEGWTWERLIRWLTTGDALVFDLEYAPASGWEKIL